MSEEIHEGGPPSLPGEEAQELVLIKSKTKEETEAGFQEKLKKKNSEVTSNCFYCSKKRLYWF